LWAWIQGRDWSERWRPTGIRMRRRSQQGLNRVPVAQGCSQPDGALTISGLKPLPAGRPREEPLRMRIHHQALRLLLLVSLMVGLIAVPATPGFAGSLHAQLVVAPLTPTLTF